MDDEARKFIANLLRELSGPEGREKLRSLIEGGSSVMIPELGGVVVVRATAENHGSPVISPSFASEDEALDHARKVAALVPGSDIFMVTRDGEEERAVFLGQDTDFAHFFQYDQEGQVLIVGKVPLPCVRLPHVQ